MALGSRDEYGGKEECPARSSSSATQDITRMAAEPSTSTTLSDTERQALRRPGTRLPLVLVVLALTCAILLPQLTRARIARLRNEINQLAEPARQRLLEVQVDLAIEASSRRGYLLTRNDSEVAVISTFRAHRLDAERQLAADAQQLDQTGAHHFAPAVERLRGLDSQLDSLVAHGGAATTATLAEQLRNGLAIRAIADSLSVAIEHAADERRASIGNIETGDQVLTAVLLLFGLVAAFMVARLGITFRALALRLDESESRLRQVAASRQRLVRGFTHDVKNPLGAADGYLALLDEGVMGELGEAQQTTIRRVRRSIRQALELIARVLEVARAEAGQLDIQRGTTDLAELVRDVSDAFRAQAGAKQQVLEVQVPVDLPTTETDATRVRQVVANLISNAVKYTPAGGHLAVRVVSSPTHVEIAVSDDGAGITPEQQSLLFTEFTRFDPAAAEGAGIGLAISQHIARALGGEIVVQSAGGAGSTFTLRLPRTT